MVICPIIGSTNFDHLDKMMSAGFLNCKVIILSFVIKVPCGEIHGEYVNILYLIKFHP